MSEPDTTIADGVVSTDDDGIIRLGDGDGGNRGTESFIDPVAASGVGTGGSAGDRPRKRGRPTGGKNKSKAAPKNTQTDLDGFFTTCIFGIHQIAASLLKAPDLELDEAESERLAKHARAVIGQYSAIEVSPKAQAWVGLIMACGGIYGPRLMASKMRRELAREERAAHMRANPQAPRPMAAQMPQQPVKQAPGQTQPNSVVQFPAPIMPAGGSDFGGGSGPGVA